MTATPTDGPYQGTGVPASPPRVLPPPPPWRTFRGGPALPPPPDDEEEADRRLGTAANARPVTVPALAATGEVPLVNAALRLRKPLLITGPSGIGKSTVAFRVARELRLGRVLHWTVTGASTLRDALCPTESAPGAGPRVRLGPLGTAFLPRRAPRVLLVEGLDRGHFDLPVELRALLRRGRFEIPELQAAESAVGSDDPGPDVPVRRGVVECAHLPVVIITAGPRRLFPPDFLADCLPWEYPLPTSDQLRALVRTRTGLAAGDASWTGQVAQELIARYLERSATSEPLPVDQLLDAIELAPSVERLLPGTGDAADALLDLLQGRTGS